MYQISYRSFFNLISVLCVAFLLQSCGPGKPGVWKNEKINAGKKDDLHKLNTEALGYLKNNQYKALQFMMSKEMLDDPEMIRTVELISIYMKQDIFSLMNEYYAVSPPNTKIDIGDHELGVNNFDLYYTNPTAEMYVAFYVQQKTANKRIISAVYNKLDYGWKLTHLDISPYMVNGKTAPELFTIATAEIGKGYLIDALNTMALTEQCIAPTPEWEYACETQMDKFQRRLMVAANSKYKFPFYINQVPTHPQIIRVLNQKTEEGQFPTVYYISKIKLKDTVALKKENEAIKKVIGDVMPGINKDKKYVFYSAFNDRPSPKASVDHFDMRDKLQ